MKQRKELQDMKTMYELGVSVPSSFTLINRRTHNINEKQREEILKRTEYNTFSFPAGLLTVDFLSDSGTTSMTDIQWASMLLGDESYGRNKGYYILLDTIRDTFERGDHPKRVIDLFRAGETDINSLIKEVYSCEYEGGFVNGGTYQLKRPNAFLVPQGRCAEYLLFSVLSQVLKEIDPNRKYCIPNNGHFDTTLGNINSVGIEALNFFGANVLEKPRIGDRSADFKGNMDCIKLEAYIQEKGKDSIPLIYLTITNNTVAGQPVSMANIKEVNMIAKKYDIPLFFDACRFAENAYFIKTREPGYSNKTIQSIVKEMFSYADGFTISLKKDGLANIGGGLFFKDCGVFHSKYSINGDIGVRLKEKQILAYGNDSYGGLSGRDIMSIASGLYEVVKYDYLQSRIGQVAYFAQQLNNKGIPVILPAGGHAVYLDMNRFFEGKRKPDDYAGVGFTIELIRRFGIRSCELGYFAFEWEKRTPDQQAGILDLVRFAVPRNLYGKEHIDYTVAAVAELYKDKETIPSMLISRGAELTLRHFQSGLDIKAS